MWDKVKWIARIILGSVLIIVGIIGGLIPVLQGWVFILAGAYLIGLNKLPWWQRTEARIKQRIQAARDRRAERKKTAHDHKSDPAEGATCSRSDNTPTDR